MRNSERSASGRRAKPRFTPLAAAVIAALHPVGTALAQEAEEAAEPAEVEEAAEPAEIETVVVTGSRIRKDSFSSAAPMDVVLTESAKVRGVSDVATMLQTTTVAAGSPQVTPAISSVNVTNGGLGSSTLSLRGLGANRTLVLLNGRRAGPSGVQGAVSSFDLNTIPLAAIERVEILKDGASSIYGSDAIAGVVNIFTRKDEGAEFNAFYSQPGDSGGEQYRVSGSWGKSFDRGYFRATGDYSKQEILQRGDRDFFDCNEWGVYDQDTGARADLVDPRTNEYFCDDLPWGHVWVYDYAEEVGDGTTNAGPPIYLMQYDRDGALAANGVPPLETGSNPYWFNVPEGWYPVAQRPAHGFAGRFRARDPGPHDAGAGSRHRDCILEGEFQLTDDTSAYGEVLLSRRESIDVGWRQVWTYIYNEDHNFGDPDAGDPTLIPGSGDPLSEGWTGAQWLSPLTLTEHAGQRVTVDYTRFVAGLRGELDAVLPDWSWELSFQYSLSDGEYEDDQVLDDALSSQFFRAGSCVGETSPISNRPCVDIPWLDPAFLAGDVPQEVEDYLYAVETGTTEYRNGRWKASYLETSWTCPPDRSHSRPGFCTRTTRSSTAPAPSQRPAMPGARRRRASPPARTRPSPFTAR